MESLIQRLFIHQWQRKLVALLTATIIWIFVNHTITDTKTIPFVPIRVINLPTDKIIQGLQPNGFLSERLTLTISGTKDVIEQLEPGDLEVLLDVSNQPNETVIQITKKNLVSLNPSLNLLKHITSINPIEYILKMSPILIEKIPIIIHKPVGEAPKGYSFLDIWPKTLYQTVSGPQEQVLNLKSEGFEITFNLNDITQEQLDVLHSNAPYDDEVSYYVPEQWKKVVIPFSTRGLEPINDPDAKTLIIDFLRQQLIPLKNDLPLHVFYPLKYIDSINPKTHALASSSFIQFKNDIPILNLSLLVNHVSKLFLEVVRDNIELEIVAAPRTEREKLEWNVGFIDDTHLEDTYVAFLLSHAKANAESLPLKSREREKYFRKRFRTYMQQFTLYLSPQHKLNLESRLEEGQIRVHVPNAFLQTKPQPPNAH